VAGLGALGIELDGLFHSPWQRAVETAVELQALGGVEAYGTALLADAPTEALFELVRGRRCAALVGHEPWTSDLLDLAVGGYCGTTFKKGGVAWLRGAPEAGELELLALLPPRVLVKLA
jgi:phosphohistidine phosphatase